MARRTTKAATQASAPTLDRAQAIAEEIATQIKTLFGRNWREIDEILVDGDTGNEINLGFKVAITDRPAQPGEHASKDNRILTTMSFSVKHSDKIEGQIPDPSQMELSEQAGAGGGNGQDSEEPPV